MELVRPFTKLNRNDAALAGGKGASLGEMTQAGIPVPPGFVVLSESFGQFICETDLVQEIAAVLDSVNHKEIHTVEAASEKIRALILNAEMPASIANEIDRQFKILNTKYVAVRSSATAEDGMDHAWAGQLESYLNTEESDILPKVKLCWSSLFTPRAIFYRFEKGLHTTKISVAVVVQKMVESEVSGIAFSVHPVTEDRNQLIIEAGFGLGEAIVSGSVTPDSYVVEKEPRNILDINVSTQDRALYRSDKHSVEHGNNEWVTIPEPRASSQVLTKEQILELSKIIIGIENHYGFPCDIEWAYEKGKFYIVQSRPITTLQLRTDSQKEDKGYPVVWEGKKLNWVKFLERKRTPFIYFPFIEIEAQRMPEICGFRFFHHLYKWTGDTGVHFRVADEFVKCDAHFLSLIMSNDPRITQWAHKGYEVQKLADKWLKDFANKPIIFSIEVFNTFYEDFIQILLYTATMPYLVLSTIDNELTKGATRESFKEVLDLYEPLRNTSKYPELERTVLNSWFNELGKKRDIESIYIHFMTPEEIRNIEVQGVDKETLINRKKWSVLWNDIPSNQLVFSFDDSVEKDIPILNEYIESTDTLKGATAFPGYAKGIVRIVNIQEDVKEFNQGDILVSLNTNPDLIPIIKKASAIVTDEGGIMCHAAIVSREFKIPCVIGTKQATKILKDGDVVEVDAGIGVVRIVSRNIETSLVEKAKNIDWQHWVDRPYGPFMMTMNMVSAPHKYYEMSGLNDSGFGYEISLYQYPVFYYPKDIEERNTRALEKYFEKKTIFDLSKVLEDLHQRNLKIVRELIISKSPIRQKLSEVKEVLKSYSPFLWLNISLEKHFQARIDKEVPKHIKGDSKEFIGSVSISDKKNAYTEMLELLDKGVPVSEVHEKFAWMKSRDGFSDFYTVAELEEIKKNHKVETKGPIDIPKPLEDLVSELRELTYLRTSRTDKMYEMFGLLRPILIETAKEIGISFKELQDYDVESIISGDTPRKIEKPYNCLFIDGQRYISSKPFVIFDKGLSSEIVGVSAYQGKITGPVKIIRHPDDLPKVVAGDILVAQMTLPSFISALQKAVAFVTDEGGITCHAAIIAREMKKPCIIGTKIATQVLKDGDMVEVDAEKGVVRIIK